MPQFKKASFKVIYFYLLCALFLFFAVDRKKVAEHAWPKTLSRLRVEYSYLVNAANGIPPGHLQLIDGKRYFNAIISIYGQRSDAYAFLGMSYYYLGDRKLSRAYFLKLKDKEQGFFWAYYDLAVLAYLDKDYSAAGEYCQTAVQLPAEMSVAYMMGSKVYQPLFVENAFTPQILARNIERAKMLLLQMFIAIKAGNNPAPFIDKIPVN